MKNNNSSKLTDHKIVIAGQLQQEYILPPAGNAHNNIPGGMGLYAAAGAKIWVDSVSLLAKVGENYPTEWLAEFEQFGIATSGVQVMPQSIESVSFYAYDQNLRGSSKHPATHYLQRGLPFPKDLLTLSSGISASQNRSQENDLTLRLADIPSGMKNAKALLMVEIALSNQLQLSTFFSANHANTISCAPKPAEMANGFSKNIQLLANNCRIFFTSEQMLRNLFWDQHESILNLAAKITHMGAEMVVVSRGFRGSYVLEKHTKQKWHIPPFGNKIVDPTGSMAANYGGVTAGYYLTLDPVEAALYGCVSESICCDGSGPMFMLQSLPELGLHRLRQMRGKIKKIKDSE